MTLKGFCVVVACVTPALAADRSADRHRVERVSPSDVASLAAPAAPKASARRVLRSENACEDKKDKDKDKNKGPWQWNVTDEERQAAAQFYQKHSPKRWGAYESLPEEQRKPVWGKMVGRYKMIQFIANDEPVHAKKVRQVELEDEIFSLKLDLLGAAPAQEVEIKQKIRQKVQELVANQMDERATRLARLEKLFEEQKERFLEDVQNQDAIVDEIYQQELSRKPAIAPEEVKRNNAGPSGEKKDEKKQ